MPTRKKRGGPRIGVRGRLINERLRDAVGMATVWCDKAEQWRHVIVCLDDCFITRQRACRRLQDALEQLQLPAECAPPRKRKKRRA